MSAELSLLTRTLCTVLLATTTLIASGSSWGCWKPSMSESEKVILVFSRGVWIRLVFLVSSLI